MIPVYSPDATVLRPISGLFVADCTNDEDGDGASDFLETEDADKDMDLIPDYIESSVIDFDEDIFPEQTDPADMNPCIPDVDALACADEVIEP